MSKILLNLSNLLFRGQLTAGEGELQRLTKRLVLLQSIKETIGLVVDAPIVDRVVKPMHR